MTLIDTDRPPTVPAKEWRARKPSLLLEGDHDLCSGCGEPIALRSLLEVIEELGWADRAMAAVGIGCYTALTPLLDVDMVQALHGRAPSVATGLKRMRPDRLVFTLQGDGDMVNEGLQEVLHSAARGEAITCVLLNNGVFGETGGHMTATTVLGQRTKNTLEGRDAKYHGHPISMTDLLPPLGGVSYVARGTVTTARDVERTRRYLRRALEAQIAGDGFSFVEILTMCPTGWFIPVTEGPGYLNDTIAPVFRTGEFKADGKIVETQK
ncbi:MAG: hypothetical protein JWM91_4797 [Rhodospirillales bacterium]|nr:hypothetical protein [Rhodospirillales bacterium]